MINIKPVIVAALERDEELLEMLGGQKVFHFDVPDNVPSPLITYAELNNDPLAFGDEKELFSKITMAIKPWTNKNKSTSAIAAAVDRVITSIGGTREQAGDEDQLSRESKPMIYSFVVENETGEIL